VLSLNVTRDLESDLIGGLFGCNLDQDNVVPNDNGTFLDLVFTNAPVNVSVAGADSPLLKLERHHRLKCGFTVANFRLCQLELSVICSGWLAVQQL
jgi:hypothetical protein